MQCLGNVSELLVALLQSHGITAVHEDGIVSLPDSQHRFALNVYKSGEKVVSLEALCKLGHGPIMREQLAGFGETQEQAVMDAQTNFVISVFHVWVSALLGISNQQTNEYIQKVSGRDRKITIGFPFGRGDAPVNDDEWQRAWLLAIQSLPLSQEVHWASICYARHADKVIACDALLDNEICESVEKKMLNFDWPNRDGFYSVRQFMIISDHLID